MSAFTEVYSYGVATLLVDQRTTQRSDGLDQVVQEWVSNRTNLFKTDQAMDGFRNVFIDEIVTSDEGGGDYRYSLTGSGLIRTRAKKREKGYPKKTFNLEGFDEISDSWLTREEDEVEIGDRFPGHNNMVCITVPSEPLHRDFYRVQPRYVGILDDKPYKRRISVNGQQVSPADPIQNFLPGADSAAPKTWQFDLPKIVVTDSIVQVGSPDTTLIPGNVVPPDPPAISEIVTFSGVETTSVWPSGWKIANIDGEFIPGTQIWIGSLSYEYVWPEVPK